MRAQFFVSIFASIVIIGVYLYFYVYGIFDNFRRKEWKTSKRILWFLAIVVFPPLGLLIYFFVNRRRKWGWFFVVLHFVLILSIIFAIIYMPFLLQKEREKVKEKYEQKSLEEIKLPEIPGMEAARRKAKEAAIVADMRQLSAGAEMVWPEEENYSKVNCDHSFLKSICEDIEKQIGSKPIIHQSKDSYCAYIELPTKEFGEIQYYCIDSEGNQQKTTIDPGEKGYCDGLTFVCPTE